MKTLTFFLGAGFSKAAGYPLGDCLSKKIILQLKNCSKLGLFVSVANYLISEYERKYEYFDYEGFYEYLMHYDGMHTEMLEGIPVHLSSVKVSQEEIIKFEKHFMLSSEQRSNVIFRVEKELNLSLYNIFKEKEKKEQREKYLNFIKFVKYLLSDSYQVNIFTLNHDLLLENILKENGISFSDGFESDSKYQLIRKDNGDIKPLRNFYNNNLKNNLRLFKLHGSVDLYWISNKRSDYLDFIKSSEPPYSLIENCKLKDIQNERIMDVDIMPLFLTGKDSKSWYKKNVKYFEEFFQHLHEGLKITDVLIFIGYSFRDEYIDDEYLSDAIEKENTHIIDLKFDSEFLLKQFGYYKIAKPFENVTYDEYLGLLLD